LDINQKKKLDPPERVRRKRKKGQEVTVSTQKNMKCICCIEKGKGREKFDAHHLELPAGRQGRIKEGAKQRERRRVGEAGSAKKVRNRRFGLLTKKGTSQRAVSYLRW